MSSLPIGSTTPSAPAWPAAAAPAVPAPAPAEEFQAELPTAEHEPAPAQARPSHPGAAPAVNAYLNADRVPDQPRIDVLAA